MKNLKKLTALLLSVLMLLAISMPSFAADGQSTITFNINGKNISGTDLATINAMAADNPYSVSVATGATVEQAIEELASDNEWRCVFTTYSTSVVLTSLNGLEQVGTYGTSSWDGKYWNIGFISSTTPELVRGPDLGLRADIRYDLPVCAKHAIVGQTQQLTFTDYDENGNQVASVYNVTIDKIDLIYEAGSFTW